MRINDIQDEIIECFSMLDDWHSKYEYLLEMEKDLPLIDAGQKSDKTLVHGCNSKAWIQAELIDGRIHFTADAETAIARAILALVIRVLQDHTPQEALDSPLYFIEQIGLMDNLSMTRVQGVEHLMAKLTKLARDLKQN
jgi:cysteine desulfuration protein SufE